MTSVTISCLIVFSFDVVPVSAGVIVGVVVAVIAVALIILTVLLIVCFLRYRYHNKGERTMCAVRASGTRGYW